MGLNNFKELLVKKTDDESIQFLLKHIKDNVLVDMVYEKLEKMATMGNGAKDIVTTWAGGSDEHDHEMLRDALGHHVTKYNAANKAGDKEAGDKHLNRAMNLMNFGAQAMEHSDLKFEHVPTKAWEMNYSGSERNPNGRFKSDPEGLKRRLTGPNGKFPDHRYLEQEPHEAYVNGKAGKKIGEHRGAYPFEEIKINGRHIDIDHDHEHSGAYEDHEFDHYPAFKNRHNTGYRQQPWEKGLDKGQDAIDKHDDEIENWEDEHGDNYRQRKAEGIKADPEGHENRGMEPSEGMGSRKEKLYSKYDKKPTETDDEEPALDTAEEEPGQEDTATEEEPSNSQEEPAPTDEGEKKPARRKISPKKAEKARLEAEQKTARANETPEESRSRREVQHKDLIQAANSMPEDSKNKLLEQIYNGDYDG